MFQFSPIVEHFLKSLNNVSPFRCKRILDKANNCVQEAGTSSLPELTISESKMMDLGDPPTDALTVRIDWIALGDNDMLQELKQASSSTSSLDALVNNLSSVSTAYEASHYFYDEPLNLNQAAYFKSCLIIWAFFKEIIISI